MPKAAANQMRSLQCKFLWGGNEGSRKMAWIKWDTICKSKKEGGLGIKNPLKVNTALLLKWVWRFLGEEESLWTRIIKSRHGTLTCGREEVRLRGGGRSRTGWWGRVVALAGGSRGKWFREKLNLKLGDGKSAKFWEDIGINGKGEIFETFSVEHEQKRESGGDGEMGGGGWRWELAWRRELFEREKGAVENLISFLGNFKLVEGTPDRWQWGTKIGSYSVKEAYKDLSKDGSGSTEVVENFGEFRGIWKTYAPFKAQLMSWRLFWKRLPTGDNLSKVIEIPTDERICHGCKMMTESASHLFF